MGTKPGALTPDLLRGLMRAHGFSNIKALADAAHVPHSSLYKFESGEGGLGLTTRRKLAVVLPGARALLVADIIGVEEP